jgi:hypothetical protein
LPPQAQTDKTAQTDLLEQTNGDDNIDSSSPESAHTDNEVSPPPANQPTLTPEQAFESFYLKEATKEFANDLDKLRSAPDFRDGSVGVLIEGLRQGTACFEIGERRKIGEGGVGREG